MGLFGIVNLILYICNMEEIWKEIEGYPNYQVSNMGRVKRLSTGYYRRTEKILKPQLQNNGYLHIILSQKDKTKCILVHRLVAQAFMPNPNNLPQVNHKDENKQNNMVWVNYDGSIDYDKSNLEWCDRKYNINYGNGISKRVKTNKENGTYKKIGEINYKNFSKSILQFSKDNSFIRKWDCIMDVQRELGYDNKQICSCLKNRQKTAKGFKWVYADDYERIPFKVFKLELYRKKTA